MYIQFISQQNLLHSSTSSSTCFSASFDVEGYEILSDMFSKHVVTQFKSFKFQLQSFLKHSENLK